MTESRSKKFFYNTLFTALLQIANIISMLIVPRFMLKYYGSEINGLVTSVTQFITYFNLVEAGLSNAAIFALYKPLADKDSRRISSIVSAARKFYFQAGYIFVSLTIGLAVFYPLYVGIDSFSPYLVALLVIVLGSNGFLEFFTLAKYRVLLTADQKTYVVSASSIIHILLQTLIISLLATLRINIVIVRAVAISSILLRSIILSTYCKRKYKNVDYKATPDMKALDKRWDAMFLQILGAIHQGTTVVLLTVIVKDLALVSVYAVFNVVVSGLNSVMGIFNSGLSASFGEVIAKGEKTTLQRAYKEFEFGFYMVMTFVFAVAFVMIMPFVKLYTSGITDANYNMPIVGFLMVLNGYMYNIKNPQGMLVMSAGMYKETKWRTFTQGAIAVVGGIVLAFPFGIYGILVAALLSNIYRDFDLLIFSAKRITGLSPLWSFKNVSKSLLIFVLIILPFFFININISSWTMWIIIACSVCAYAAVVIVTIVVIFDFKMLKSIFVRLKRIFIRG
ncbi:MAG: hypothetical protein J6B72_06875 [Clostridia bacterium]|nr:hypothetical protein [Clostridia bacterium]